MQYIWQELQKDGVFSVLDFVADGRAYATTCYVSADTPYAPVKEAIMQKIAEFDRTVPSRKTIIRATNECAIEFFKQPKIIDIDTLVAEFRALQQTPWCTFSDLTYEKANDATSVNTLFDVGYLRFDDAPESDFSTLVLEYSVDERAIPSPPEQALAVLLIQVLALNFVAALRKKYTLFDEGDQWSTASATVGYRMFLRFHGAAPSADMVQKEFVEYMHTVRTQSISKHIVRTLQRYAKNPHEVYIGRSTMNDILGGCVIGGAGWQGVANAKAVEQGMRAIELVSFYVKL